MILYTAIKEANGVDWPFQKSVSSFVQDASAHPKYTHTAQHSAVQLCKTVHYSRVYNNCPGVMSLVSP